VWHKPKIYLDDLGKTFADALKAWSRHLSNEIGWNHEALAAHHVFNDLLGTHWSPGYAPSRKEMAIIERLAPVMDFWKVMPHLLTPRSFKQILEDYNPAVKYIKQAFFVDVSFAIDVHPMPARSRAFPTFAWLTEHTNHASNGDSLILTGGVGARKDGKQPEAFLIKGNLNSMKYHLPNGKFYQETIAEVWFADDRSASIAGFEFARGQ
jgi:hypothetical protein